MPPMPLRSDAPTPGDPSHPNGDVHIDGVDAAPSSPATPSRGFTTPLGWTGDDN